MDTLLGPLALDEITERHRFFERWFNGEADETEFGESLQRFDPLFRRVDPAGRDTDRASLHAALAARRGSRRDDPLRIGLEEPRVLWQTPAAVLAAYVEVQSSVGEREPTRRRSTALFLASPDGGPPLWRHVQETFLHPGGPVAAAATPGDGR